MLAHIGGVPVEESLLYLAPVILLVGWMYYAGWRERRARTGAGKGEEEGPSAAAQDDGTLTPDEQSLARPVQAPHHD